MEILLNLYLFLSNLKQFMEFVHDKNKFVNFYLTRGSNLLMNLQSLSLSQSETC